jgi:hypothetical protein
MASRVPRDGPAPLGERPSVVRVTVEVTPAHPAHPGGSLGDAVASIRRRAFGRPALVVASGLVAAAVVVGAVAVGGAIVGGRLTGSGASRAGAGARPAAPATRAPAGVVPPWGAGPDPIEAANRSPLRCVRVVIAPGDPSYGRAELDRAGDCWRNAAWVTTIIHRVAGTWRPVLLEEGDACLGAAALPAVVRSQLGVCPPGAPPAKAARRAPERNHH